MPVRLHRAVFWLVTSVALHAAILLVPFPSALPVPVHRPVEVGLIPSPPQVAGLATPRPSPPSTDEGAESIEEVRPRRNGLRPPEKSTVPPIAVPRNIVASSPAASSPEPAEPSLELRAEVQSQAADANRTVVKERSDPGQEAEAPDTASPAAETAPGAGATDLPLVEAAPLYAQNASPPYPRIARARGWEGEVLLRVAVAADGGVRSLSVERSSGYAPLDDAARRAVRRWRFRPARRGEDPVAAEVRVPVRFELRSS